MTEFFKSSLLKIGFILSIASAVLLFSSAQAADKNTVPAKFGEVLWETIIDGTNDSRGPTLAATRDGGAVFGLRIFIPKPSWGNIKIVRLDKNGEMVWEKIIGDENGEKIHALNLDAHENIIIGGVYTISSDAADHLDFFSNEMAEFKRNQERALVAKLSADGNLLWQIDKKPGPMERLAEAKIAPDGTIITVGNTREIPGVRHNLNGVTQKYGADGQLIWSTEHLREYVASPSDVAITSQGEIYAVGYDPDSDTKDIYVVKLDVDGQILWERHFGADDVGTDTIYSVTAAPDGSAYLAGSHWSAKTRDDDAYLIRIGADGENCGTAFTRQKGVNKSIT